MKCMKCKQSRKYWSSDALAKRVQGNKLQRCLPTEHQNKLRAKLLFQQKKPKERKLQVFVFIWASTKLRGGDCHTLLHQGERGEDRERESVWARELLPGDLKVPMFPHFWELVIYSCWSHIKQDQRLLPDIFWTYWGNSNDYQRILPTNDDTGTILRESKYKTNTEPRQAAHKGTQLNGFHDYS